MSASRLKAASGALAALAIMTVPSLPARGDDGNADRGERVFDHCYACHSVDPAQTDLQAPNLYRVVGRRAASLPGFDYSPAMRAKGAAGLVWTAEALDTYLTDPAAYVPHGRMVMRGLPSAQDRADVIAYLRRAGGIGQ